MQCDLRRHGQTHPQSAHCRPAIHLKERFTVKTTPSTNAARASIAALLLCATFGTARAQDLYGSPSTMGADEREEQAVVSALTERRQQMIDDCELNNGTDCEREVDTELRAEALQSGGRVIHLRPAR